jgi:hypothetical protein
MSFDEPGVRLTRQSVITRPLRQVMMARESSSRLRKRMWQKVWPGAPSVRLMVAVGTLVLAVPFLLTYGLGWPWWHKTNELCDRSSLGCGLSTHLIGTLLFGVIVYYLFFLRREARAAATWRAWAKWTPERLFTWLGRPAGGLTEIAAASAGAGKRPPTELHSRLRGRRRTRAPMDILGRDDLAQEIADDLDDDADPLVLVGNSAAGKTMVLVRLADVLARRGQVPVAFTARGETDLNFERLARRAYEAGSGRTDEDEAKKQWRWLRRRRLVTVLVDDLEKADVRPDQVAKALEAARRQKLRVVATSRPYGLPADFRQGRIDLEPLPDEDLVQDLLKCMRRGGITTGGPSERMVRRVVESAEIGKTPYYLSIARVLARQGELAKAAGGTDARLSLLKTYRETLAEGKIREDAGLTPARRSEVLTDLEAIAFVRLRGARQESLIPARLAALALGDMDVRSVLADARRLGVVEVSNDGHVQFAHATTLAYFGSCFLVHHPERRVWSKLAEGSWSPLRSLALVFASVEAADGDLPGYVIERLLDRTSKSNGSGAGAYGRPNWIASAAEIAARAPGCQTTHAEAIVASTENELRRNGALGREQAPVVNALADLKIPRAYEALWKYATEGRDYAIRRAAIKALSRGGARAVEALIPIIADVMERAEEYGSSLTDPCPDDRGEPFDGLKAVAWMLPSLRSVAGLGALDRRLATYQSQLVSYASTLSAQRGLEAGIAQGLKLDAIQKPFLPNDPLAIELLSEGPSRARFWFSRVLLLQALTIRYPYDPTPEALELISQGASDEQVFVREVAGRCLRTLVERGRPSSLLFEDLSDATSRAPHGEDILTVQLIGDIALSLNLNEYGSPAAREAFGTEHRLPACLSASQDRREVLMYAAPHPECPFTRYQSGACLCPYTYDAPEPANRRELSRAFCRHLRLHARRSPWQSDIKLKDLKGFWRGMEDLAQF